MSSTLRQTVIKMRSANMRGESSLPALGNICFWHRNGNTNLPEEDGLFIGYGHVPSPFPYRMQDMYTRELYDADVNAVVLENEHLRATFLPDWGGKLMSLFDKDASRELLYVNPVIRPCNLAIRNAWTSGGIEWNCGIFGHNVHTCERIFTAVTKLDDGTPVLRMYEYERIRRVVKQMDFFIPEGSKLMYARMRIINPLYDVTPMYWWSNIAVPETGGCRVIVNADASYVQENNISLVPIPEHDGFDGTRPRDIPNAMDHFYKVPERARKFEAQLGADGYGLVQTSTYRLRGRKLFAWGNGPGGDRWQEYLSEDGNKERYTEIQAGLACTQYECIPMPPKTTWEWLEAYGAMSADPARVHGDDWQAAKRDVAVRLDRLVTEDRLEEMLDETRPMAKTRADEVIFRGAGWCALENLRRAIKDEAPIAPHLDFGKAGAEQEPWLSLMNDGTMGEHDPNDVPVSWMLQDEFIRMMEDAVNGKDSENWYTHLQLGAAYCAKGYGTLQRAYECFEKSLSLKKSAWAMYCLGVVAKICGNNGPAAEKMMEASVMAPCDESLAKEAMAMLTAAEMYEEVISLSKKISPDLLSIGRIRLYITIANIKLGDLEYAERVLWENGGLVVADIREGENIITNIYLDLEEAKAKRDGRPFDRNECEVPAIFDYRVSQRKKKKQ